MRVCQAENLQTNVCQEQKLTLYDFLLELLRFAQLTNHWVLCRLCFVYLEQGHHDLADSLTLVSARHLKLVIGQGREAEILIHSGMDKGEIVRDLAQVFSDPLEQALAQEVIVAIGSLLRTEPYLFAGLRSIQLHNFMLLCSHYCDNDEGLTPIEWLSIQSPGALYGKLKNVLDLQRKIFDQGVDHVFHTGNIQSKLLSGSDAVAAKAVDADWFEWRTARGFITRFDDNFLSAIWQSLANAGCWCLVTAKSL